MNLQDEISPSILPGDDFYNYVNKKWRDDHPIPADKSRVSALSELSDTVLDQLHTLLEKPATKSEQNNSVLAKRLFASGMDIDRIEKRGIDPILPFLNEIEHVSSFEDLCSPILRYLHFKFVLKFSLRVHLQQHNLITDNPTNALLCG